MWLSIVLFGRCKIESKKKWMFNVRLAGDHLYWKWLFTRLSLVMSLMVSYFVLYFSHELSWMISRTELSQFHGIFLPNVDSCIELQMHNQAHTSDQPHCNTFACES